jgi:hypothetical protein
MYSYWYPMRIQKNQVMFIARPSKNSLAGNWASLSINTGKDGIMQKRRPFYRNRHRLIGILLLFLSLLLVVFLIQHQANGGEVVSGASGSSSPALSSRSIPVSYPANIDLEPINSFGTYNPKALANPNIAAVDVNMNWVNVEPRQGVFNWKPVDNEIAAWATHGKKFTIIARFINEGSGNCNGSQLMPAWEIASVPHFCSTTGQIIPDYFNSTFTADFKTYVRAIAQHIAASPYRNNLLYIRLGIGMGGEGFPVPNPTNANTDDKAQLQNYGYTPAAWAAWQKELMTYYKSIFPSIIIIYPVNGQDIDPTTGQDVSVENANWAAANGFGVGQQGLRPGTNSPLFQSLRSHYPNLYIQYQTIGVVNSYKAVQADILAAKRNGAQSIEWYSRNAVNPNYQPLFAQWQQAVNSKFDTAGEVGKEG